MSMSGDTSPAFEEFAPRRPFTSLFSTTRDVLLSPRRCFSVMPPDGPARWPVTYLLACYLISALLTIRVRESGSFVGGESGSLYQGFFFRG